MINLLYTLTSKGLYKALSLILAAALFAIALLNSTAFAQHFGGKIPYLALIYFYGMAIHWIHGIGFEIKNTFWQCVFLPINGYIISLASLIYLFCF